MPGQKHIVFEVLQPFYNVTDVGRDADDRKVKKGTRFSKDAGAPAPTEARGVAAKYDEVYKLLSNDFSNKAQLAQLVAEKAVKVHIEKVVTLEGLVEAHEYVEKGHTRGKVVIRVAE